MKQSFFTAMMFVLLAPQLLKAEVRISTFNVDATPEVGMPVAYVKARSIADPLSARGIVLTFEDKEPVVLCAVDWIGIGGEGLKEWKKKLAEAAGTSPSRVSVHSLHQHDGARCDFTASRLLRENGIEKEFFHDDFQRGVIEKVAAEIKQGLSKSVPVTHLGTGKAKVEKVASNRRLLGEDGKVKMMRFSRTKDKDAINAPEGVIDPFVHLVSFWNEEQPVAVLSYYASHPQSHYGQGDVTCEFVGIARNQRDQEVPEALHVHFTGAGGNIAAGKYNDGSPENRPVLTEKMRTGMQKAWEQTTKQPLKEQDCKWVSKRIWLPVADAHKKAEYEKKLKDPEVKPKEKFVAALKLSWLLLSENDWNVEISCLRIGNAQLLNMPGELFVEYSLAAEKMKPNRFICMAAYEEYACGYIGTEIGYWQGGYETSARASGVTPDVEKVLLPAIQELLDESEK